MVARNSALSLVIVHSLTKLKLLDAKMQDRIPYKRNASTFVVVLQGDGEVLDIKHIYTTL